MYDKEEEKKRTIQKETPLNRWKVEIKKLPDKQFNSGSSI